MPEARRPHPRVFLPWVGLLLATLTTRLLAMGWNADRLFGDVNLFALVARRWLQTGALEYPSKYDFSAAAPYLALATPASQHPPAWSWLGGALAALLGTHDTYFALQLWSLLGGVLLVASGAWLGGLLGGRRAALACGGVLALHPYLIDYSANGSPYLWIGLAVFVVLACAVDPRLTPLRAGALAGLATGIAASVHGAAIALLPFGLLALLASASKQKLGQTVVYLLSAGLVLLPTCWWMHQHFGSWWHTTTTDYVFVKLGRARWLDDALGIRLLREELSLADYARALGLAAGSTARYALHLACELGWLGLVGLGGGIAWLLRSPGNTRRVWLPFVLIALGAGLPCWLWPSFKFRFLTGLLPLCLWLVAYAAARQPRAPRWAFAAAAGVLIFWAAQWTLTGSPGKYYAFDREHRRDYAHMQAAAEALKTQPPGVVLTFSDVLDGGVEAAYWHEQPIIAARGFPDDALLRLARDFSPRYALAPPSRRGVIDNNFPDARLLHEGPAHLVYLLRP